MKRILAGICVMGVTSAAFAEGENVNIAPPAEGSVSRADGLEAWTRIYDVTSHPTHAVQIAMWALIISLCGQAQVTATPARMA